MMLRFSPRPNRAHLISWHEWGEEAFQEAQQQGKLVILFIGAFWCGFCQRLDETSFSSDEVIAILNAFFVPIRVEESQRPDIDLRYNQNGWPMIVFLTATGDLLFAINYLDPDPFVALLAKLVDSHERGQATELGEAGQSRPVPVESVQREEPPELSSAIVAEIAGMLEGLADSEHGGFGTDDKYFHTEANELLMYLFETTGDRQYLDHVLLTLDRMRQSRTFDAEQGGFFRYSSRRDWQEPHPEKILDDQAALLGNYLHTFVLTDAGRFRETAEGLVDYLDTTLLDREQGVFFGCQDYVRAASPPEGGLPPALQSVIDTCIYCDANARVASAYLQAWWLLGKEECGERARSVLEWLWAHLRAADGSMYHYWDGAPHQSGLLMDSVMMGHALLDAHALLGDELYLTRSRELAQYVLLRHRSEGGGFFDISVTGPAALGIPMTVLTQNASLAAFFVRLADLSGEGQYRQSARWALHRFPNSHRRYGAFAAGYGHALAQLLGEPVQVRISGHPGDPSVRRLLRAALTRLRPRIPVVRFRAAPDGEEAQLGIDTAAAI